MIDSMEQEDFDIRNQQPVTSRERDFENALRPLNFEDFSGQDKVVDNLRIFVKAARLRGEALDLSLIHICGFTLLDGWHFHAVCLITNHFIYDLMIYDVRLKLRSCD